MCIQLVLFQILTSYSSSCCICVNFTPVLTLQHIASDLSYFLYQVPIQMHHVPQFCESLPLSYKISPDIHLRFPNPFYSHTSVSTLVIICMYVYVWYLHEPLLYRPVTPHSFQCFEWLSYKPLLSPMDSITGWSL
jgi:hypothetical protein